MTTPKIAVLLLAGAALAGCASATSSAGGGALSAAPPKALIVPSTAAGGHGPASLAAGNSATIVVGTPQSSDIERSVDATYTVPAGTFLTSFEGVIARAVGLGGYVVSSRTEPDAHGRIVSGEATLRVPAPQLADLLNGMPAGFVASAIDFSSVDHTAQFVDVNARLASAHAHLAALDGLLARAVSLSDITSLEQQIEQVQTEIDADQGELNVLSASVELATATVRMSERGMRTVPTLATNPVSGGLGAGWGNAVRVTGAALEGVVSALPVLALLLAGLLLWRRLGHAAPRRARRAAE